MKGIYEKNITITDGYLDGSGNLNPAAVLTVFQEMADEHAIILKCAFADMIKRGLLWVLTSVSYKVFGELKAGDNIRAITVPRAVKGIRYGRDFAFYKGDDEVLVGTSEWVFIDKDSRHLVRATDAYPKDMEIMPPLYLDEVKKIGKLSAYNDPYAVVPDTSDIDRNNHVNNVKYVNFALKALKSTPKYAYFQIDFIKETLLGETLQIYTENIENKVVVEGVKNGERSFSLMMIDGK